VATVMPYTSNATSPIKLAASPVLPRKPPLTLQESGIFEEEEEEEEEEVAVEVTSRSTQTEAPSGELLQEVQRLQELRVRIQERAAKITTPVFQSTDSSKICLLDVDSSIVQVAPYQERVRDLEVRLEVYEEAEKSREQEKRLTKQREEELLDENYRLTEKVHWLENELRIIREPNLNEDGNRGETITAQRFENEDQSEEDEISDDFQSLEDLRDAFEVTNCKDALPIAQRMRANKVIAEYPQSQLDQGNAKSSDQRIDQGAQGGVTVCNLRLIRNDVLLAHANL